jgi:hypothetical protein
VCNSFSSRGGGVNGVLMKLFGGVVVMTSRARLFVLRGVDVLSAVYGGG